MKNRAVRLLLFLVSPMERARGLRRNDSAQALLLSGFMAFLLVVFMIFAMNASEEIYRRLQIQNASDAAADVAALWQARGVNMVQSLDNAHYVFNAALYLPMILICVHCLKTWVPCTECAASLGLDVGACIDCGNEFDKCDNCNKFDDAQEHMAQSIYNSQTRAIEMAMREMFLESDRYAAANGADPYFVAAQTYTNYPAYKTVKNLFPIHNFLKSCMIHTDDGTGCSMLWEHGGSKHGATVPGQLGLSALHAVPLNAWGGSDQAWGNLLGDVTDTAPMLGYKKVFFSSGSMTDFPWVLPDWLMKIISTPWLDIGGTRSDGWNDYHWVNAGVPTLTWATAMTNRVGGLLHYTTTKSSGQIAGDMFWFLNPSPNEEVALAPLMGIASGTSEGLLDATNFKKMIKSLPSAISSKSTQNLDGVGRCQAKGTIVPVKLDVDAMSRQWFGGKSAEEMGILH